jgi:sulfonate transport system permease protein
LTVPRFKLTADHLRGAAPFVILLALWGFAGSRHWINTVALPSPEGIGAALSDPTIVAELGRALLASIVRVLEGGIVGIVLGVCLGGALGLSPTLDRLISPTFHAFRQVPLFAWIPLLTAWLGGGESAKIVFVALAAFKPALMGAYEGVHSVSPQYREVGQVLCFPSKRMLWRIVVPSALPATAAGLQLALIYSWLAAIGAEYLMGGVSEGVGAFVVAARERLEPPQVYLGILVIAIMGLTLNKSLRWASARAMFWKA